MLVVGGVKGSGKLEIVVLREEEDVGVDLLQGCPPALPELQRHSYAVVAPEAVYAVGLHVVGGHVDKILQNLGLAVVDLNYICPIGHRRNEIAFIVVLEPVRVLLRHTLSQAVWFATRSIITFMPRLWAVSTNDFRSASVPCAGSIA